ncbi:MAG: hypothetical protein KatS3mg110_2171 [Pirellulaceae bacterium]|nr:MAG: hypothetical protein KatS3mg110_2171 [Pirellulaceae bacterium]
MVCGMERLVKRAVCKPQGMATCRTGFQETLDGQKRSGAPVNKVLNGEMEPKTIALRLGPPPEDYGQWTLRLLAQQVVEPGIVSVHRHHS